MEYSDVYEYLCELENTALELVKEYAKYTRDKKLLSQQNMLIV